MIFKTLMIELLLDHCFDLLFVSGIKSSQELNRTFWYVIVQRSAKVTVQGTTILRNQLVLILPVEVNVTIYLKITSKE